MKTSFIQWPPNFRKWFAGYSENSLEIRRCGEGLRWGVVKHETKGGLALQSTVSDLGEFGKKCTDSFGKYCVKPFVCLPK